MSKNLIASVVGLFIAIIIGVAFIESLDATAFIIQDTIIDESAKAMAQLIPLFFVLIIVASVIGEVIRRMGDDDYIPSEKETTIPHYDPHFDDPVLTVKPLKCKYCGTRPTESEDRCGYCGGLIE